MLIVSEADIQIVLDIFMKHIVKDPLTVAPIPTVKESSMMTPIPTVRVSEQSSYRLNFIDFIQELKSTDEHMYWSILNRSILVSYFNEIQDVHNLILNLESKIMLITNSPDNELYEIHRIIERLYDDYHKTHI
jgi:hypothetical protein